MADTTTSTIKILVINVGVDPIQTERLDFSAAEAELAGKTCLEVMNRMGKNSEALVKYKGSFFTYSHTAPRGPSKKLHHATISYHPMMDQLT